MNLSLEKQRLTMVLLLILWCLGLLIARMVMTHDFHVRSEAVNGKSSYGLIWNLFLAVIPLFCSSIFQLATARKHPILAGISFFLWLLFLPNAPYILTDLLHLGPRPDTPLWYVLAILLSFAGAGTLLGYLSLLNVQAALEARWGKVMGWFVAVGALMLSGFGIYLGRFLRWNSWDFFTHPLIRFKALLSLLNNPDPYPHPVPVTLVFGIGLIIGYLALRVIAVPTQPALARK